MTLQPQDVVIALYLATGATEGGEPSYATMAGHLGISTSQAHAAVQRAGASGLVRVENKSAQRAALLEFLLHGVRYAFPVRRGPIARGFPTAHSAAPLASEIQSDGLPVVWPDNEGSVRGESLEPLHRSATKIARQPEHAKLYQALALVDAIRGGRTRERRMAGELLKEMIES